MGKLRFKRKANRTLFNIVPQKAIVDKTFQQLQEGEKQQHTSEWSEFISKVFLHNKLVTVTIEWDD